MSSLRGDTLAYFTLGSGTLTVSDSDHIGASTVTLARGTGISSNHGNFVSSNNGQYTLTFTPNPNADPAITITGIHLGWGNANNRPGSPISLSGGGSITFSDSATSGDWTGTSNGAITATFTRRSNYGRAQNSLLCLSWPACPPLAPGGYGLALLVFLPLGFGPFF